MGEEQRERRTAMVVIFLVACASLVWEVLLTRVCALRLAFHYSYLVISNGLLAIGASGSVLFLLQSRLERDPRGFTRRACLGFWLSLPGTWAFLLAYPVPGEVRVGDPAVFASFLFYNLVAAVPFFFAGLAIGAILATHVARAGRVYAADLVGAGFGCLVCPFGLWWAGAGGAASLAFLLAGLAFAALVADARWRTLFVVLLVAVASVGVARLDSAFPVPSKTAVAVTEDKSVSTGDGVLYSRWSAISRVDLYPVPAGERELFGLGRAGAAFPIPFQRFLLQDGDAGTYVTDFTREPAGLEALERSTYAAACALTDAPRVLVIGVGGGHDVWAALSMGARSVRGYELNRQILDVHRGVASELSRGLVDDERVELVHGEGRAGLMRDEQTYDVVQMSGIDTWTALASGGYMLAENYLYTVEAMRDMLARLADGGLLQITRYAQEVEPLRLLVNFERARGDTGTPLRDSVVLLHTSPFVTALFKKGAFSAADLSRLDAFLDRAGITAVCRPDQRTGNIFDAFLRDEDRAGFVRDASVDLSPTTDDRPYFFHFSRWRDPLATAATVDAPAPVTQGNPLFLLGQLAFSLLAAGVLILGPLLVERVRGAGEPLALRAAAAPLGYFAGVGLGFIGIEIALMQKLVLALGHPLFSITVTLFAVLVFSGLGSFLSQRLVPPGSARILLVPPGLAVLLAAFAIAVPELAPALARAAPPVRFLSAAALVAPIAILLGVPFAWGLRTLSSRAPQLVPWAWAVNAAFSVVGSILTVVLSMNFGFRAVFVTSVVVYALTLPLLRRS
ncbi:MAG: hypothetical protein GY711_11840 [bacterium]|nr:hypothetical protein [bacterium]